MDYGAHLLSPDGCQLLVRSGWKENGLGMAFGSFHQFRHHSIPHFPVSPRRALNSSRGFIPLFGVRVGLDTISVENIMTSDIPGPRYNLSN